MILLIDNNLPPVIAEILNPLAKLENHEVIHKRKAFGRTDIPDVEWIQAFGKNKDAAFLTCDTHILKRPLEVAVFRKTPITGFWLKSKSWKQYLKHGQLHIFSGKLLTKWPTLVQAAELGTGQAYEIPVSSPKLRGLTVV